MDSPPTIQKQYPREDCSSLHSDLALRQHRAWPMDNESVKGVNRPGPRLGYT